ncbi:ATP-binding protein [Prevotella sp.]|uniref:ATP-binding protein n=1 Tax=Prevotella sp. TaxID=59823 RepID=UPI0027E27428|nr:ATP-binding protein [Prevotella sp.]
MKRTIISQLKSWKESPYRKPLILAGARQVGKTYILKEFGKQEYDNVAYINCDGNSEIADIFAENYDMSRILMIIGAITKQPIVPGKTLIILDEIQELRKGLSSLKYFCEDAPEYHIAVAGSLLGVAMHQGESAPVGKVDILRLYPMSFEEYLLAKGEDRMLDILQKKDWTTTNMLHESLTLLLREFYFVGGMPEAVKTFLATNDANAVRKVQNDILFVYRSDMSKHVSPNEATRISMVWQSIPSQLAKENKKFVYGALRTGARAKDFEMAIQWLVDAGLVYRISRVREIGMPLKFYEDFNAFKLFLLDVGLLGALCEMEPSQMLISNKVMTESKGAFTENYVLCQLMCKENVHVYYYSREDSRLEIDFLVQHKGQITPVEVKAEENLRSKSLRTFIDANPSFKAVRFSMSPFMDQDWMTNVPLYAVSEGI